MVVAWCPALRVGLSIVFGVDWFACFGCAVCLFVVCGLVVGLVVWFGDAWVWCMVWGG